MPQLVHEYLNRPSKLIADQQREARERLQALQRESDTRQAESVLAHPGWAWYRQQIAEMRAIAQKSLEALTNEITYGAEYGEKLAEMKARARGLQGELHAYEASIRILESAVSQVLTGDTSTA